MLIAALIVSVLVLLTVLHVLFWGERYRPDRVHDETHYVTTDDGWRLAIHRYRGRDPALAKQPVVLCHGLGVNHYNFDLTPACSLTRYLRDLGWDVWAINLRGAGESDTPSLFNNHRWGWTFEDHLHHDVPTALNAVLERTGAPSVHWIGHSMGSMLMYAYLPTPAHQAKVRSVVALGSPGAFRSSGFWRFAYRGARLLRGTYGRFQQPFIRALAPFYRFHLPLPLPTHYHGNTDVAVIRRSMAHLITNLSPGLGLQSARWPAEGKFCSHDGRIDYTEGLHQITTPWMLLTGSRDMLAPPDVCAQAFDALGSDIRKLVPLGKAHGQQQDYGHGDLLIGRHARDEVFPLLADWLNARATDDPMAHTSTEASDTAQDDSATTTPSDPTDGHP